jgi:hypothetical protein
MTMQHIENRIMELKDKGTTDKKLRKEIETEIYDMYRRYI